MIRLTLLTIFIGICFSMPVLSQADKQQPAVGDDCLETEYDCQPTEITEDEYDNMPLSVPLGRDLPALIELDNFDPEEALIRRFMLNARGVMGREVPIPDSKDYFCTLSRATNLTLQYFPASELWSFVIAFDPQAELLAGGLATCLNVGQVAAVPGENAE